MADKIFRIILNEYGYDEFDSAIVQCESAVKLTQLIADGEFSLGTHTNKVDREQFNFYMFESAGQQVKIIEELGTASNPMPDGYEAAILCSSFNAG